MLSQKNQQVAMEIAQFVAENGRVESRGGKFNPASMEVEVSFEASERGFDSKTAEAMGKFAAKNSK